jgi:Mlc titration factor MtfA (ptsG expression regulator)
MEEIRETDNSIFRKYGATNIEEFLAVSVEVFFEQTEAFYAYNPMLYKATCNLLMQDPLPNKQRRSSGKG